MKRPLFFGLIKVIHESLRTGTDNLDKSILNKWSMILCSHISCGPKVIVEYKFDYHVNCGTYFWQFYNSDMHILFMYSTVSDQVYQLLSHGRWFSPGTPASSTTKIGRHDIAEILLKVAVNTINLNLNLFIYHRIHHVKD